MQMIWRILCLIICSVSCSSHQDIIGFYKRLRWTQFILCPPAWVSCLLCLGAIITWVVTRRGTVEWQWANVCSWQPFLSHFVTAIWDLWAILILTMKMQDSVTVEAGSTHLIFSVEIGCPSKLHSMFLEPEHPVGYEITSRRPYCGWYQICASWQQYLWSMFHRDLFFFEVSSTFLNLSFSRPQRHARRQTLCGLSCTDRGKESKTAAGQHCANWHRFKVLTEQASHSNLSCEWNMKTWHTLHRLWLWFNELPWNFQQLQAAAWETESSYLVHKYLKKAWNSFSPRFHTTKSLTVTCRSSCCGEPLHDLCMSHTHTHTSHESQHTEPTWIVHKPSLTYMEKWCDSPLDRRVAVILLLVHSSLFTLVSNVSLFARGVSSDKSPSEILQEPAGTACCCCIQNILHKASEQEWAVSDNGFPKDEWIEEGKPVWA